MSTIRPVFLFLGLSSLLGVSMVLSLSLGAMPISLGELVGVVGAKIGLVDSEMVNPAQYAVFWSIRLPRVIAGVLVGGALALSGVCLQGLFRNPLSDPSLIGVSAGGSFAAALVIVLGIPLGPAGYFGLPGFTFLGALVAAFLAYRIARFGGKTEVSTLLLAGIAINAFAGAGTGMLTFVSSEAQLRSITFWLLGSLGGANWGNVAGLLPFVLIPAISIPFFGKELNAYALGETNAGYLGVHTARLKIVVILLTTLAVGASVSIAGIIGFVGLVVPHTVRMVAGQDYRILLPASLLLGGTVLVASDLISRTLFAPSELPIGIITALLGTPIFVWILVREKGHQKLQG